MTHEFIPPRILYSDVVTIGPYWEHEEHIRPVWKLYWNKSPGASLFIKDRQIQLVENSLFLISPMTRYKAVCPVDLEHLYIHFNLPGYLSQMPRGIWTVPAEGFKRDESVLAVQASLTAYSDYLRIQSLLSYALSRLPVSLFEEEQVSPLYELFLWLEDNLSLPCRNIDMSEEMGITEDSLNRLFKRETGRSPQQYVRDLRISHAANALKQSQLTIDEIAENFGFYDRSHFHRIFQDRTGLTPAGFRKYFLNKKVRTLPETGNPINGANE